MTDTTGMTRREALGLMGAAGAASLAPTTALPQETMPRRPIPKTGELLPVVGLGSSKVVSEISTNGTEPVENVIRALVSAGGGVIDTWPRNPFNDTGFGKVINMPDLDDYLFVTTKIDSTGSKAGIDQFRQTQELYQRETLDLVQIFSLTDLDTQWPNLRNWKEEGSARYIGVTVSNIRLYDQLIDFLGRETPDFIQVNYSITEREAEQRLLPMAADMGLAVLLNRPFMNGEYFGRLANIPLPEWTTEFGCTSWAQFSLKYILANTTVTCVFTETSNPAHMIENAHAAYGTMPDANHRQLMREYIDQA